MILSVQLDSEETYDQKDEIGDPDNLIRGAGAVFYRHTQYADSSGAK